VAGLCESGYEHLIFRGGKGIFEQLKDHQLYEKYLARKVII
jgi:hypothetical protein